MKTKCFPIALTILVGFLFAYPLANPLAAAAIGGLTASEDVHIGATDYFPSNGSEQSGPASDASCANPFGARVASCQTMEQEILDSTVRLIIYFSPMGVEGSDSRVLGTTGHATVKEGRYLVTHNHYDQTLFSLLQQGDPDNLVTIDIFNASGAVIWRVAAQDVSVHVAEHETVVLDFGETNGYGLFAALGLPSAEFRSQPYLSLVPGMEVAQVDYDGVTAHINWVTVEAVTTESATPIVKLSGCLGLGASGGGLFWRGVHIGNNWSRSTECNPESDSGTTYWSKVALNSQRVTAPESMAAN